MSDPDDGHVLRTFVTASAAVMDGEDDADEAAEGTRHSKDSEDSGFEVGDTDFLHADQSTIDPSLDRRVRLKLDILLLPFVALLFLLNSLDKSNIGNAETAGFTRDAGLEPHDINAAMAAFFAVFVALQPVGAALGRRIGMRRWVPPCMSLWGACTLLHIWVRRRWQLILLRIAIAALEAGFFPTSVSYLSLFYVRYEFGTRLAFFYGQTAVAGVLGSVLSWAVFAGFPGRTQDDTLVVSGWKSWEILFLIEGCMTMTIALLGFFWLPASANTAWFFHAREREWAERRIQIDTHQAMGIGETKNVPTSSEGQAQADDYGASEPHHRLLPVAEGTHIGHGREKGSSTSKRPLTAEAGLSRHDVLSAFLNFKIWHLLICNILSAIPATAFGVFLPMVVKRMSPSLNLSPAASNLLSAPPFACGAVALYIFTRWSDVSRQRLWPILAGLILLLVGVFCTIMVPMGSFRLRYAALCVLLSGSFIASPLTVAWLTNNTPEPGKRAVLLGINGWGNLAGVFLAVLFTPADRDKGYVRPLLVTLACVLVSLAGFGVFRMLVVRENRWRKNVLAGWTPSQRTREERVGDAFLPATVSSRLRQRLGIDALARSLGGDKMRRGDENVTFLYSL